MKKYNDPDINVYNIINHKIGGTLESSYLNLSFHKKNSYIE